MKKLFVFLMISLFLNACSPSASPTHTADPCTGATETGARDHFTYDQILPCLDDPEKIVAFMSTNITPQPDWDAATFGDNSYPTSQEVYAAGADDCDGLAEFAACTLSRHGYEAYNVGVSITGPWGYNVAGYVDANGQKFAINGGIIIEGPFATWDEMGQYYIDKGKANPVGVLWLFAPCIPATATGDAVFNLPHIVFHE